MVQKTSINVLGNWGYTLGHSSIMLRTAQLSFQTLNKEEQGMYEYNIAPQ